MSMDDQYAQLQRFHRHLESVNTRLAASARELAHAHDRVDPLWQDTLRRTYEAEYAPFAGRVHTYLHREAPNYERFLREKTAALNRYLHGN